jgi:prepilin-type processing-associated H-X9-DG protein
MIEEIYDHMVSEAATALGCDCLKAYPNWARPLLTPPIAALEIASLAPAGNRIGQPSARHALGLRLYVFAQNEAPGLAGMLEQVQALEQSIATSVVDGRRVNFAFADGQRHINQSGAQQEDHGFSWYVSATYSLE